MKKTIESSARLNFRVTRAHTPEKKYTWTGLKFLVSIKAGILKKGPTRLWQSVEEQGYRRDPEAQPSVSCLMADKLKTCRIAA